MNGGLHCGYTLLQAVNEARDVLPPMDGGLHCGSASSAIAEPVAPVLPPMNGGCSHWLRPLAACFPKSFGP